MPNFRWTLDNTVSGTQVIGDPQGWENLTLSLIRDSTWHGVNSEFSSELGFYCQLPSGIEGGKEYIDNIFETQGIDALITILVEYRCSDGSFDTLFDGKLELKSYRTGLDDDVGEMTFVNLLRDDFWQQIRNNRDIKVNLNSLLSLDGSALTPYVNAPASINTGSQIIDLMSEIDGGVFLDSNLFDGIVRPQFVGSVLEDIAFQSPLPIIEDDLKTIGASPDFHNKAQRPALLTLRDQYTLIYDTEENDLIEFPETYTLAWDFTGDFVDTVLTPPFTNRILSVGLNLVLSFGPTIASSTGVILGTVPGYNSAVNPLTTPFVIVGGTTITLNRGDKMWLYWQTDTATGTGYVIVGGVVESLQFDFDYVTSEFTMSVASQEIPGTQAGFAWYEVGARVSESITNQTSFAFKSNFLGRTDSEPNLGNAPVYVADGCGSLFFLFSGISLRNYAKHKLESPLPDFTSLDEYFEATNAIFNIGIAIEQHLGQDVVRLEEKDFFYSNSSIIQLTNVNNITFEFDESFMYNEFEVGYEQWQPEDFNGLDEICTKQEYNLPIITIKNKLTAQSSILASGYAIENIKRISLTQGEDHKYDNTNFIIAVRRVLGTFQSETNQDFLATAGIDNPGTRRNMKLTPKRNFLRWLNVLGAGLTEVAGATIDFRKGEANFYFDTTIDPLSSYFGCNGDFTAVLLDEDQDMAWDDASARLNSPLWDPRVYEFDHPLTEVQYTTIRNNPHGFIEFSSGTSGFTQGFILQIDYPIQGGLTHFKLLRRHT